MADMIGDGLAWLASQFKASAGIAATLTRGATSVAVIITSEGGGQDREYATQIGNTPEETVYVLYPPEIGYCGFVMAVANYNFGPGPVKPQRGDKLTIGADAYAIEAPAGLEPWKYADLPYKNLLWLHTKLSN